MQKLIETMPAALNMPWIAVDRLVDFIEYIDICSRKDAQWVEGFKRRRKGCRTGKPECKACMTQICERHMTESDDDKESRRK